MTDVVNDASGARPATPDRSDGQKICLRNERQWYEQALACALKQTAPDEGQDPPSGVDPESSHFGCCPVEGG
ncbi:hypothetical protein PC129_g12313 [Phytophthora cactorum]|uniref:Uncharacterized protein n=1 Tax=Phytophthora cactorum TaxID=29920 RepID=A0A8T1FGI8_9STRA|nr:hypothetical protein Pcac1_g10642 [Phytophthora cactorum]KAG2895843.1 hypothetical protein PC114_g15365 [Phytophthora cactorum]KAG2896349.1 hypothetical protein PC115_g17529 [Phytophthora cactorum]KAG2933407.1 hypothetical protein PC117_g12870 [Phytophthora cactorum]KAG2974954.1 hypothetical protein PC118_g14234 [Phytophthora cactorum]